MTQQQLFALLQQMNIPVAYSHFNDFTAPPFITYQFAYSGDFFADGANYMQIGRWQVELYSEGKDLATEKALEKIFKDAGIGFAKSEFWLDDEKLFQVIYEISIMEG